VETVIERDRELLARLARVNQHLGEVAVKLMAGQDCGELPADGVRDLGQRLTQLGADLLARAAQRDGRTIGRVIIDAQPLESTAAEKQSGV
jgi:hypothetical protein